MDVQLFDSFDDAMERLRSDMEAADARVQPWQAAIKAGDYYRQPTDYGFPIYGEILNEDEPREPECRHYRLARAYSVARPEGEMGDVHVSSIEALLSREAFEAMRRRGWLDD